MSSFGRQKYQICADFSRVVGFRPNSDCAGPTRHIESEGSETISPRSPVDVEAGANLHSFDSGERRRGERAIMKNTESENQKIGTVIEIAMIVFRLYVLFAILQLTRSGL